MNWFDSVADVELAVACSGVSHRLVWHQGSVVMADHADADAEIALVALGGDRPACLDLMDLWSDAVGDGGFLEEWVVDTHLSRARLSWIGMALERLRNEGFHEFLRSLPPTRAERMGRFLHSFPRPWLDRAAATVAAALFEGDGVRCENAQPLISDAITQRVRRCFVASIGRSHLSLGAAALVPLRVEVAAACAVDDGHWMVEGQLHGPQRGVTIVVDEHWLHRVWAAGAGVIDDHFVVALDPLAEGDRGGAGALQARATVVVWGEDAATPAPTLVPTLVEMRVEARVEVRGTGKGFAWHRAVDDDRKDPDDQADVLP